MGQVIKYINPSGESIEFSISKPFLLEKISGLSNLTADHITYKGVNQDGEMYKSSTLNVREIEIKFMIIAHSNNELLSLREKANRVFNPKLGEGKLIYSYCDVEREIYCTPDGIPNMFLSGNKKYCQGTINLLAYNPYWENVIKNGEIISTWIGGWKFKFKLPFKFKQKGEPRKNIYNEGHMDTPVEVIFKGPAVNPSIINRTTGEFIKVERTLTTDDTLYITTEFGNKKVEIEKSGVRENAFHYIDLDSTFFQLQVGDNMIEYTTENNLDPQSIEIRYKNRYVGV